MKTLFLLLVSLQSLIFCKNIDICFVTTHKEGAEFFSKFIGLFEEKKISWRIYAAEYAEDFLKNKKIAHHKLGFWTKKPLETLSKQETLSIAKILAKECKKAKIVITDVSEPFVDCLNSELSLISKAKHYIYCPDLDFIQDPAAQIFQDLLSLNVE